MYNVFFSQIYSTLSFPIPLSPLPPSPSKYHGFFFNPLSPFRAASVSVGVGTSAEAWATPVTASLRETDSPSQDPSTANSSSDMGGSLWTSPPSLLQFWLDWSCSVITFVSSYGKCLCHVWKTLFYRAPLQPLALTVLSACVLQWSLSFERRVWNRCPI